MNAFTLNEYASYLALKMNTKPAKYTETSYYIIN